MPAQRALMTRLRALAKLHHVETSYVAAGTGKRHQASEETLRVILERMGVEATTPAQIERSIKRRHKELRARTLEPVTVAWNGRCALALRLGDKSPTTIRVAIELEDGQTREILATAQHMRQRELRAADGDHETVTTLRLPGALPMGYHTARVTIGRTTHETRILSAPTRCFRHEDDTLAGAWGLFAPTYAIRSERATGCGDLTDLRDLADWAHGHGSRVIATLPLLSVYLDEPFDPSPYSPVSKLFWNELFLDATRTPEFDACAKAKRRFSSQSFQRERDALRAGELVQYRRQAQLRRSLLEPLAEHFFEKGLEKSDEFGAFLKKCPEAKRYARFRAVMERQRRAWSDWSQRLREGRFRSGDFDPAAERYHLYAQLRFNDQLEALSSEARARDGLLYLDLAVGVRDDGFDSFSHPELFGHQLSVGAPPDPAFTRGQDWGFPPMLPEAIREDRYDYFIEFMRMHMRPGHALRLDHVMAFFRIWWVPLGYDSTHGAYVRYHMDEQLAIMSIESHRNACQIVGENIGTVPHQVERAIDKHALAPLFVAQFGAPGPKDAPIAPVRDQAVASLNTHDLPPFAKWWAGTDSEDRLDVGLVTEEGAQREREGKAELREKVLKRLRSKGMIESDDVAEVRDAFHRHIAAGDTTFALINIEDLWLEAGSQNIPGTVDEHPNWRRRLKLELDQLESDTDVARQLAMIDHAAKKNAQASEQTTASTPSS